MTIEKLVDKHYEKLFQELMKLVGDDFYDLVIEVKAQNVGKTIRRSWKDREAMLANEGK